MMDRMKPILFSTDMVKSILEGRKNVTRRPIKPQPEYEDGKCWWKGDWDTPAKPSMGLGRMPTKFGNGEATWTLEEIVEHAPFSIGDILYVRETWRVAAWCDVDSEIAVQYKADGHMSEWVDLFDNGYDTLAEQSTQDSEKAGFTLNEDFEFDWTEEQNPCRWRPSLHMPKWAARLFLEITDVRVERVQDISEADAQREGWDMSNLAMTETYDCSHHAREWFATLWDSIYAKQGLGWESNPYVWVFDFKRYV